MGGIIKLTGIMVLIAGTQLAASGTAFASTNLAASTNKTTSFNAVSLHVAVHLGAAPAPSSYGSKDGGSSTYNPPVEGGPASSQASGTR